MDLQTFITTVLPELFYCLCGLICLDAGYHALTSNQRTKYGTALFWLLVAIIFIFGSMIDGFFIGCMLVVMALLTVTKQVGVASFPEASETERVKSSKKLGNKIFIPAVLVGVLALALSCVKVSDSGFVLSLKEVSGVTISLPAAAMIGISSIISVIFAVVITKAKTNETRNDTSRQLMQVGAAGLLPQLLAALGVLFTEAGVGEIIAQLIGGIIPEGNTVIGVIIYCVGMMVFTMIMGNAFAAFSVITLSIGIPFVIAQGGDPVIVAALGMTAGFCGTLLTPMAANFNIVPTVLLDMKDKWGVIKAQLPMALILLVIHIVLMCVLAF